MSTPTGPPETMAAKRSELTPMLRQYLELCEAHEDAIVLFQVGDFYEAFCEAAESVARICEVTLTKREDSTGTYPMAGIPIDNASTYLERLLDAGYRVAIADQIEDADAASGLVDRAVTQVITPGTIVDDELLKSGTTNYLAAVCEESNRLAVAAIDVSTGECFVTSGPHESIASELDRIRPAELLVAPDTPSIAPADADKAWMETRPDGSLFDPEEATDRLSSYLTAPDRRFENDAERRACGAALGYAEYTQGDDGPLQYVSRIRRYDRSDRLELDAAAIESLELFENRGRGSGSTLFGTIDETTCALGRRCLTRWLRGPLVDHGRIEARLDAVARLAADPIARETLREELSAAYDLERLNGRVSRGRANARDLRSLESTLAIVPELRATLTTLLDESDGRSNDPANDRSTDAIESLLERLDPLSETRTLIDRAIVSEPPIEITEGGLINEGFDEELDRLRTTTREGREWVASLEEAERERTGIDSLSVGHNEVHGYYIEVTNPNLDRVPDDYTRRQTLKNAERFYTPELKQREDEILGAAERADALEYELFCEVRSSVAEEVDRLQSLAGAIAELDALCSLATVAVEREYVRPEFHDDARRSADRRGIEIEGGRHPVVETREESFVPNDTDLPRGSIAIVTGPNMSGKSTYMRQVALIVLLAQVGSFVPAEAARLPIVDRIFTRVGASDDIAGGESTFMREMTELTEILHDATDESLVLLDEVGRGTSTADGRAIARATIEYVHDELGAMTLFATHYHEVTALSEDRENVFNLHFAATRSGEDVTFLHRVSPGASSSSYGIEVARMAGVPRQVVDRAADLVATVDAGDEPGPVDDPQLTDGEDSIVDGISDEDSIAEGAAVADADTETIVDADAETIAEILETIERVDVANTTPMEALQLLDTIKRTVE